MNVLVYVQICFGCCLFVNSYHHLSSGLLKRLSQTTLATVMSVKVTEHDISSISFIKTLLTRATHFAFSSTLQNSSTVTSPFSSAQSFWECWETSSFSWHNPQVSTQDERETPFECLLIRKNWILVFSFSIASEGLTSSVMLLPIRVFMKIWMFHHSQLESQKHVFFLKGLGILKQLNKVEKNHS